jgi:hypothetical protein
MKERPNTLDYKEARLRVSWWWHFVYGDRIVRNWLLLIVAAIGLLIVSFFLMAGVFGIAG